MSPSHFNRAFKSLFGNTPAEFVETLRINEAKRRLSVPKRTLDTVAASVGFSDAQKNSGAHSNVDLGQGRAHT
jgi:transcriptional regulator GlxA family with amidase domain